MYRITHATTAFPAVCALGLLLAGPLSAAAQTPAPAAATARPLTAAGPRVEAAARVEPPADYVIGPDDVLTIVFWRDKDLTGDVSVRPDGRISLPLLNDVPAAGLTPEQLRVNLTKAADQFVDDPTVTVVVKEINSRKVFITGQVAKPGPYPLVAPTTVMQLLAMAGGVLEYSDAQNISIMRVENGRQIALRFNYKDVTRRKNLRQNIDLKPGDTIVVP